MAWRSVIAMRPAGLVDMIVLMGEGRFFGLVPMGEGHTYGFGAIGGERFEDPLPGRLERFRRRFTDFAAPVPRISRLCKVTSSSTLARLNGLSLPIGIVVGWP
jgi:hypothetical protein